jgi:membrane-associated protein
LTVHGGIEANLELLEGYGYGLLFAASVAENLFLVGLLVPGDVIVVIGGALAARAYLSLGGVLGCVVVGVLIGANVSYGIGRRGGMALVDRWGRRSIVGRARVDRAVAYFRSHGAKTVFLAAFVAGIKNLVPAIAGASLMPVSRFVFYNAAGSIVRSTVLVLIGYLLGSSLPRAVKAIGLFNVGAIGGVAVLVVALVAVRRLTRARRR